MLIASIKADDIRAGMILLISNIHYLEPITITTDCAHGFVSKLPDKQLSALSITIHRCGEFNHNYNAVVDHTCQEQEAKIQKQAPEGGQILQAQLTAVMVSLNSKIRRGKLSAN